MDSLIKNIQASRNMPDAILYGGALQDNTDQYYTANNLASQSDVPAGPPKIFRNYGATAELDNRPFMSVGLQVPRNPEQEALNQYFSTKRIADFAVAQGRMNVSEQIAKQAELMANNVVRDEIDRRAGIRRTVLDATGLTPAQIEQEMAADALGGINRGVLDIRDRQVQDAVNLYYNMNNIPLPITTQGGFQGALSSTVPTEVARDLPAEDADAVAATDVAGLAAPAEEEQEEGGSALFDGFGAGAGGARVYGNEQRYDAEGQSNAAGETASTVRGIEVPTAGADEAAVEAVNRYSKDACITYILSNNIVNLATRREDGTGLKSRATLKVENTVDTLREIVIEHMSRGTRFSLANNQGMGAGK
jgi:hypothetical protein